jgi:opacity protein-like surface antigen
MKKIVATLAGISLLGIAASAAAAEYSPYVDLGFGYSAPENMPSASEINNFPGIVPVGTPTSSADNYGGRIALGILWDTETTLAYGLEGGVAYYGMVKYSNLVSSVDMNYYGIELLGVAQFNIAKLHLVLKGGATEEQLHPTKTNIDNSSFEDSNQVLPEVAAGIAYSVTENLEVGVSYYHVFGYTVNFNSTGSAENLPSVSMGLLELQYLL